MRNAFGQRFELNNVAEFVQCFRGVYWVADVRAFFVEDFCSSQC